MRKGVSPAAIAAIDESYYERVTAVGFEAANREAKLNALKFLKVRAQEVLVCVWHCAQTLVCALVDQTLASSSREGGRPLQ